MGNKARLILIISMLVLMAARLFHTAQQKSATFDEPGHILAGYHYFIGGDFSANAEHPPLLKLISALPLTFFSLDKRATKPLSDGRLGPLELAQAGVKFLHENGLGYVRTLLAARLPIMALGSKFSSLALIPVLAIEALAAAMANRFSSAAQFDSPWLGKKRKMKVKVQISNGLAFKIICFSLSSLITLLAVYKFAQSSSLARPFLMSSMA